MALNETCIITRDGQLRPLTPMFDDLPFPPAPPPSPFPDDPYNDLRVRKSVGVGASFPEVATKVCFIPRYGSPIPVKSLTTSY